jgi:hypothetical protein
MSIGLAGQVIIMKGLSCGKTTACQSGTMITAGRFSLFCVIPPPRSEPIGGGSRPMMPGEISQLYQPVPPQDQYYVVPRELEAEYFRKRVPVKILWRMGDKSIEKEYMVPEDKAHYIVNVAAAYNVTRERISAKLSGMKRLYTRATVKLTNFRRTR